MTALDEMIFNFKYKIFLKIENKEKLNEIEKEICNLIYARETKNNKLKGETNATKSNGI